MATENHPFNSMTRAMRVIILIMILSVIGCGGTEDTLRRKINETTSLTRATISTGSVITVPFTLHDQLILVKGRVNGYQTERLFVFDTGASVTVINPPVASELGIEGFGSIESPHTAGSLSPEKKFEFARINEISIGKAEVTNCLAVIIDTSALEIQNINADGIIGASFFGYMRTEINYRTRTITFSDPRSPEDPSIARYSTPMKENGMIDCIIDNEVTLRGIIDTAAPRTVIPYSRVKDIPGLTFLQIRGTGEYTLTGANTGAESGLTSIGSLSIAGTTLKHTAVTAMNDGSVNSAVIGYDVLSAFRIILNYASHTVILVPYDTDAVMRKFFSFGFETVLKSNRFEVARVIASFP
ncbi:MAG TPA: retropepsin-like aspartic protease, partial [Spirochaetota bacterium]|nr:retropepsin-like aspartic protease [Spirochaetota bacterium]